MAADPPIKGAAVWSSLAHDEVLNRVCVGSGNPIPDSPLPTKRFSNGLLSLNADTGEFAGFFAPSAIDSYQPNDQDVDMAGSPVIYNNSSGRVFGVGGKSGSFFLLRAENPSIVVARRQLLPYYTDGTPVSAITNEGGDFGIFSAAAVDFANQRLFVTLGSPGALDFESTPFVRALDWDTLEDAWPTQAVPVQVNGQTKYLIKYNVGNSPLYTDYNRPAGSSPAVSNDVVFVTTRLPAIYAFSAITGECLWSDKAPNIENFNLCPAIANYNHAPTVQGNWVVVAGGQKLFRWQMVRPAM
jgi:outer membrane protein assembly factor BamB